MHQDLNENAVSTAPINVMARSTLAREAIDAGQITNATEFNAVAAGGAGQVLDANQLQVAIRTAVNDAIVDIRENESKKRVRMLNDNRTAEARRDKERKHELKMEEMQLQRVTEEEKTKRMKFEQEEKTKQVEQMEKTKQVEQVEKTNQMREENRNMELQIRMKEVVKQLVEPVTPCTVEEVNKKHDVLCNIRDTKTRNTILCQAGRMAQEEKNLKCMPDKVQSMYGPYEVYQYDPDCTGLLIRIIERALGKYESTVKKTGPSHTSPDPTQNTLDSFCVKKGQN